MRWESPGIPIISAVAFVERRCLKMNFMKKMEKLIALMIICACLLLIVSSAELPLLMITV